MARTPLDASQREHLMPITHAFDPVETSRASFDPEAFKFLQISDTGAGGPGCYSNSITLCPSKMSIPWPSYFLGCRQGKHWKTAESMTKELLDAIYKDSRKEAEADGKLPLELEDTSSDIRTRKEIELVSTSVKSATYMYPDASPVRAGMIAQLMLLIFLHDDVVENSPLEAGSTIADATFATYAPMYGSVQRPRGALRRFLAAIDEEEPTLGKGLLTSVFTWFEHTKGYQSIPPKVFESLRNYLDYRSDDIGRELLLSMALFACNVHLVEGERKALATLIRLYSDHVSLTNDLYSFDREYGEHQRTGALFLNAVDLVCKLYQVSEATAKQLVVGFILETECAFSEELKKLTSSGWMSEGQIRFAKALTECLAGHILYSATSGRYGVAKAARGVSA
ncbi:isoprenoid synthase domain-containing protein [Aspergillus alliaceus]|uniref:Terpene synthase n=1 Tax=Petromyces alliaceus TaxID=209559 RepID=A0A5N7CJ99_PETAA|nr:isoprenoid synthase domain-containing protein [Aspergillus alliaceus]